MTCIADAQWMQPMPRYKPVDRSPRFLPVVLADQIQPWPDYFANHSIENGPPATCAHLNLQGPVDLG
jgi:hypothetical protein